MDMYETKLNRKKVSRKIDNCQKRKSDDDIIQRKIGFEFQTHGGDKNVEKIDGSSPKHGDFIYQGEGFRMEADGTDLEYVTEPVDESDAKGLKQKVTNAANLHITICKGAEYKGFRSSGLYYLKNGYRILKSGERTAHPQATVGIDLNKVYSFMNEMVNSSSKQIETIGYGGTTSKVNEDKQKNDVSAAISKITSINGLEDRGKGFMAIIEQYIDVCKTFSSKWPVNAKNAMPFMSRSNLYSYWKELKNSEQEAIESYINSMGEDVIIAKEYNNKGKYKLTLKAWFDDLKKGIDTLSSFHSVSNLSLTKDGKPNKEMKKYNIKKPLDIGNNRIGLLLELRAMKREVSPEQWINVAEAVRSIVEFTNKEGSVK